MLVQNKNNKYSNLIFLIIRTFVSIVLMGIIGLRLYIDIKDTPDILNKFFNIHFNYVIISLLILGISYIIAAFQWNLLLKNNNIHLRFIEVLRVYFIGIFFNNFLPSNIGGDVIKGYHLIKKTEKNSNAVDHGNTDLRKNKKNKSFTERVSVSIIIDRIIGLSALSSYGISMVLVSYLIPTQRDFLSHLSLNIYIAISIVFLIFLSIFFLVFSRRVNRFASIIIELIPIDMIRKIFKRLISAIALGENKPVLIKVYITALFVQGMRIVMNYFFALSINIYIPMNFLFVAIPIVSILVSIPVSINGWGVRELTGKFILGVISISMVDSVSFLVFGHLLIVLFSIIGGFVYIFAIEGVNKEK